MGKTESPPGGTLITAQPAPYQDSAQQRGDNE